MITFTVYGEPKAQPRPRAFARKFGNKFSARIYDAGTAEGWKGLIAQAAREHLPAAPLDGPLRVDIDFYFPRPARLCRRKDPDGRVPHIAKPDRDNAEKAVLDALTQLGMWTDDALVCQGEPRKWYAEKDGRARAEIRIQAVEVA